MSELNSLGYKTFKTVSFDSHFKFYDIALESHLDITPNHTKLRLASYLNSQSTALVKKKWQIVSKFAKEENISIDKAAVPSLQATKIILSEVNPIKDLSPTVYVHRSKPFHALLKAMNVMSKNFVAQNVYLEASRIKSFSQLMTEQGISSATYKIYTGSGLPIKKANSRIDNLASCRMVTQVIGLLLKSLQKHNLTLSDVVAVNGGKDLGSFRERFMLHPETHQAVISKTGTLMHASTLAGVVLIDDKIPFGILNQTTSVSSAKKFQDAFISRMFHYLGEPTPMDYTKISIFPWDGADFLEVAN